MKTALAWNVAILSALAFALAFDWRALASSELVQFPEGYKQGVHYATVKRGNITEELFTSRDAIEAAKAGRPLPSGTVIMMEDYRNGELYRYVVMEKRTGWGADYSPEKRNGEWEFQSFAPDRTVNRSESLDRCFACHKGQASQDFVFTLPRMKSAR